MTTIYLIRHAEAEGNLYRFAQGQFESSITATGHRQIDFLAERFKDVKIDRLYSSDLRRTQITAGAVTRYHSLDIELDKRLREISLGVCEGMSFGDMRKFDPEQMDFFNNDPGKWHCEGSETFSDCTARMFAAVTEIAEKNEGKTVAVVSHGMAIRSLLAHLFGIKSEDIPKLQHGDNTAVSLLTYENGKFEVVYYNDNSHLPEELSTFSKQMWWREGTGGRDDANLSYAPLDPRENSESYLEYYRSAWLAAHGNLDYYTPDWFLSSAVRHFDDDPGCVVGVYREEELVGILELDSKRGSSQGYGWISLLCIREDLRGEGLGIQPLGYAVFYFRRLGYTSIRLHVSSQNKGAIEFYTRWGFKHIKTEAGAGAPVYLLEKKLN